MIRPKWKKLKPRDGMRRYRTSIYAWWICVETKGDRTWYWRIISQTTKCERARGFAHGRIDAFISAAGVLLGPDKGLLERVVDVERNHVD